MGLRLRDGNPAPGWHGPRSCRRPHEISGLCSAIRRTDHDCLGNCNCDWPRLVIVVGPAIGVMRGPFAADPGNAQHRQYRPSLCRIHRHPGLHGQRPVVDEAPRISLHRSRHCPRARDGSRRAQRPLCHSVALATRNWRVLVTQRETSNSGGCGVWSDADSRDAGSPGSLAAVSPRHVRVLLVVVVSPVRRVVHRACDGILC